MSDSLLNKVVSRFMDTGVGTNAGVTVTQTAVSGQAFSVTHVSGSGDAAAVVTIESPANTVLWKKLYTGSFSFSESFAPGVILGSSNTAVLAKISTSASNSELNLGGLALAVAT